MEDLGETIPDVLHDIFDKSGRSNKSFLVVYVGELYSLKIQLLQTVVRKIFGENNFLEMIKTGFDRIAVPTKVFRDAYFFCDDLWF